MIKHTKLTKSNIPNIFKSKRKKIIKKVVTSCGTPRKIFSKSTSRNGSPYPSTSRLPNRIAVQIPKMKLSATSPRLKLSSLFNHTSPMASIHRTTKDDKSKNKNKNKIKDKTKTKTKSTKAHSKNISPRGTESTENVNVHCSHEIIDLKHKHAKIKIDYNNIHQLKLMLQQVVLENSNMKNKLRQQSESLEEPKSTMNSGSIEAALEQLKAKLENLKLKFS